tara:strand:- start:810 stop:1697 length:888 start_codon:yes stop_codon:yes gene_type:complete
MNKEYLDSIYKYYNEKNSTKRCKSCDTDKIFKETNNKIIFSCGTDNSKICGIQLDIDLPEYMNYYHLNTIKDYVNEQVNSKTLSKYIDVDVNDYSNELDYIKDIERKYEQQNKMIDKKELINDIIKKRKRLYSSLDTSEPKKYVQNMKEINKLYNEMLELINSIKYIVITVPPKINNNKTKTKKSSSSIKLKVKWTQKNKTLYGIVEHIIKDKFVVKSNNTEYILKKDKLEIISDSEYLDATESDKIIIGDKVNWYTKSNTVMKGTVIDLNKTNAIVKDDDNDEYVINISKLDKV